jgi:hypothetical protein
MQQQESTIYSSSRSENDNNNNELQAQWRRMLIDWMFFVVDYCKLQRGAVAAGAYFLDVAVSKGLVTSAEEHQLAAATCLQLALKLFDNSAIQLGRLVQLGRGLFTEDDVVDLERKILVAMNWQMHPPTTYCFLRQYELLLPSSLSSNTQQMMSQIIKLVAEIATSEQTYTKFPPSRVAYAGLLIAMELIDHTDLPLHHRHCFVVNMSNVANLESKSPTVLKAFEELKQSLDKNSKLGDLINSITKSNSLTNKQYSPMSKPIVVSQVSPRDVTCLRSKKMAPLERESITRRISETRVKV